MLSSTNMLLLKAVRDRKVRALWLGQVCSAMGDEIYRVAFIWLCVQLIGSQTGYLASLQLLAALLTSIFGARLVDHLHSEEAMIRLDLYRAAIVLVPVALYQFHIPSFTALAICALLLAGLGSLFEPVIMETIPKVANNRSMLKAANGLMSTTFRLARVLGPAVVGLLSGFIPMIHFFTIDAVTFLGSAYSIHLIQIPKAPPKQLPPITWKTVVAHLTESIRLLRTQPPVMRSLLAKCATGGAWGLAYGVALPLFSNELSPNNLAQFGMLVSAYGVGNVASALLFGSLQRQNPERMVYHGLIWLGTMFILMPLSHWLPLILLLTALAAVGGPWNDLPFADLVQVHFRTEDISKIYRLRNITDTLAQLTLMLASPLLFKVFSVRGVIIGCGIFTLLCGLYGERERVRHLNK